MRVTVHNFDCQGRASYLVAKDHFLLRSASLRASLRRKEKGFYFLYPAFTSQRVRKTAPTLTRHAGLLSAAPSGAGCSNPGRLTRTFNYIRIKQAQTGFRLELAEHVSPCNQVLFRKEIEFLKRFNLCGDPDHDEHI